MKFISVHRLIFLAMVWAVMSCGAYAEHAAAPTAYLNTISPMTLGAASAGIGVPFAAFYNSGALALRHKLQWTVFYDRSSAGKAVSGFMVSRRAFFRRSPFTWGAGAWYSYRSLVPHRLPAASSDELFLFLSLGKAFQRKNYVFAFGFSQKYWASHFAQFSADTFVSDFGGVFRCRPIVLFQNAKGAASFGAAVSNLGPQITWEGRNSEAETTVRLGASLAALFHERYGLKFSAEYQYSATCNKVWGQGIEFNMNDIAQLRLLRFFAPPSEQRWFIGLGVSLQGKKSSGKIFSRQDGALQIDATADFTQNRPGHGIFAFSYYHGGPDPFVLRKPVSGDTLGVDRTFHWRSAFDADWFDTVNYRVMADWDSAAVSEAVRALTKGVGAEKESSKLFVNQLCGEPQLTLSEMSPGILYWSAAALDNRGHVSLNIKGVNPEKIYIPNPKTLLQKAEFIPTPRLSNDNLQGNLCLTVENISDSEHAVRLMVTETDADARTEDSLNSKIRSETRQVLPPGQSVVELPWQTEACGRRRLTLAIEPLFGAPYTAKPMELEAHTVPKVRLYGDSVKTVRIKKKVAYVPLLRSVAFNRGSSELCEDYRTDKAVQPVISILAERLRDNPMAILHIEGMIDPDSGEEEISTAWQRARVVRDLLAEAGADTLQMRLSAQKQRKRNLSPNTKDLQWILQERRCVRFSATAEDAALLFAPLRTEIAEANEVKLELRADVRCPFKPAKLVVEWQAENGASGVYLLKADSLQQHLPIHWVLSPDKATKLAGLKLAYRLAVTDSLGRVFRSDFMPLYLQREETEVEQIFRVPFEFAKDVPDSLYETEMLRRAAFLMATRPFFNIELSGSACPIGDRTVNERLARKRAERMQKRLLEAVKNALPSSEEANIKKLLGQVEIAHTDGDITPSPAQRQLLRFAEIRFKSSAIF
ncbi:MAG: hypothetical protein ONB12_02410 [candidate division KSB1 bacterium]|nr:hypothetical protein [candidate division KSB1 bacterium]